jgi:TrmH family RNA methyltransferase
MLSKNQVKHIRSLHSGKFRQIHRQYIVEGAKITHELLHSDKKIVSLFGTADFIEPRLNDITARHIAHEIITETELQNISALTTANQALAVVECHNNHHNPETKLNNGLYIVLDNLQDPGNLGTIIRSADWFGVSAVFCSPHTVDVYNPKVVQAAMGSLFRVPVYYTELKPLLQANAHLPSFAAALNGSNVYKTELPESAFLLIGNESKGISAPLLSLSTHTISIPNFGKAESLNAAIACSVLLGLWRK